MVVGDFSQKWVYIIYMKVSRSISLIGLITTLIFLPLAQLRAQTSSASFFGQQHAYSLQLRGNGEAIVTLRQVFKNDTNKSLTNVRLRVPRVNPQDLTAIQVTREPRCLEYLPMETQIYPAPPCRAWETTDFYAYGYGNSTYQKALVNLEADTVTVELPKSVPASQTGSIILTYRAFGYAKKNLFGAWNYTFESLKTEDKISDLTVGINVDDEYTLKGAKGQTNYRFDEAAGVMKMMAPEVARSDATLDNFVNYQIGQGTLVKKTSNLQALDSFTIKGEYADSVFKLYGRELGIGGLVILALLIIAFYFLRSIIRGLVNNHHSIHAEGSHQKNLGSLTLLITGSGFVSALTMVGLGGVIVIVNRYLTPSLPYEYMGFLAIFAFVIFIGVISLLLLAPPLLIGLRHGIVSGLATFATTIGFLFLFLILTVIFLVLTRQNYVYPMGVQMMERATLQDAKAEGAFGAPMEALPLETE